MKTCSKCKEEKPLTSFSKDQDKKDGLCYHCKDCCKAYHRGRRGTRKFEGIKFLYGLSKEDYIRLFEAQNGVCAICQSSPNKTASATMSLHVDHCHETGQVRGLLCHKCNAGLGFFNDSQKLVETAAKYLER